jgi:glutamine kinase
MNAATMEFGTKGETLARLAPLVADANFCAQILFSVGDWKRNAEALVRRVMDDFGDGLLVVRSSGLSEDTHASSMAGVFDSVISVEPTEDAITRAVETVMASYGNGPDGNQILVQPMISNVDISGVVVTRELTVGGPYFVINYDDFSGRTDTVTSGAESKTLLVHHDAIEGLHSLRFLRLIAIVQTLQVVCANPLLDIEFCIAGDDITILQVRPLTMHGRWQAAPDADVATSLNHIRDGLIDRATSHDAIVGDAPVLSDMADWNPAEMIGQTPRPLALSLYRRLITDQTWCEARFDMGYRRFTPEPLLIDLGGRPYIDVRLSLNSLLPDGLADRVADAIVTQQLAMLRDKRDLHDKFEFEIALSSMDFGFAEKAKRLGAGDMGDLEARLRGLTNTWLGTRHGELQGLSDRANQLNAGIAGVGSDLERAGLLLENCRKFGTHPFSIVARHAFIAMAFVKSLVARDAIDPSTAGRLMTSVHTVAADVVDGMHGVSKGTMTMDAFLGFCGHLRPGTYDILSARYDAAPDLYLKGSMAEPAPVEPFTWSGDDGRALQSLLDDHGLKADPAGLMDYISQSVAGREQIKFDFTRNISDALEALAAWGEGVGLSRDDLSYLDIETILNGSEHDPVQLRDIVTQRREQHAVTLTLRLPEVVAGVDDIGVVRMPLGKPTFTTQQAVTARTVDLERDGAEALDGAIVLIEAADPGYDWILSHGIAGLVTKFGGANSHIAIRCAEFGLPAAIGCGERLFAELGRGSVIELDCATRTLRSIA